MLWHFGASLCDELIQLETGALMLFLAWPAIWHQSILLPEPGNYVTSRRMKFSKYDTVC